MTLSPTLLLQDIVLHGIALKTSIEESRVRDCRRFKGHQEDLA